MKKFAHWFDQFGLYALSLFLLIFIPLYPKIPLLDAIPGYLVRVRIEDLLVLVAAFGWFVQLVRGKINFKNSFHLAIGLYVGVGLISLLIAIFLQQTIPAHFVHLGKSVLHYGRYIEYFALFFLTLSGIKKRSQIKTVLIGLVLALNLIFIYGLGQRYLEWPSYSTMNREYSKGQALILNQSDKLNSTFGGHYDLAAWLVIVLPILLAVLLRTKDIKLKSWLIISELMGAWLIWESGSKTALAALGVALALVVGEWLSQKIGLKKAMLGLVTSGGLVILVAGIFLKTTQPILFYQLAPFLRPAGAELPVDVVNTRLDETWSENARKYGLSMGIRLDTLWPQALKGFLLNPYTGKGYATLNKTGDTVFTESDSTDNNFLRVLGETGLLGVITFFGVVVLIIKTVNQIKTKSNLTKALQVGFIASTIGLLINSVIIDVFAASKVAFTYWGLAGLVIASSYLENPGKFLKLEKMRLTKFLNWWSDHWPTVLGVISLLLLLHKQPFTDYSPIQSFASNPAEAKYVAAPLCWLNSECQNSYQLGAGVIYSTLLVPFLAMTNQPGSYYFLNLGLLLGSYLLWAKIIKRFDFPHYAQIGILIFLASLPSLVKLIGVSSPLNLWIFILSLLLFKFLPVLKIKPNYHSVIFSGVLLLTIVNITSQNYGQLILKNFRDQYRAVNYLTIKRANFYLGQKAASDSPWLLTEIEPVLFDIYQNGEYQPQILSTTLPSNKFAWLTQNPDQALYLSNANVENDPELTQIFDDYVQTFNIRLKEIDCQQKCNFYQLFTEPYQIPTQPASWNLVDLPIRDTYQVLVMDHQLVTTLVHTLPKDLPDLTTRLSQLDPDVAILVGDGKRHLEKDYGQLFLKSIAPIWNVPIVLVQDNFDTKLELGKSKPFQIFNLNNTWVATLDAAAHHALPAQNIFVFDSLLQLTKHPEVEEMIFVSHGPEWLIQHSENFYFLDEFIQELANYDQVKFKLVVNQPLAEAEAEKIREKLPSNAQLIYHPLIEKPATDHFLFTLGDENDQSLVSDPLQK